MTDIPLLYQFMPATFATLEAQLNADPTLAPHLTAFDPEWRGVDDPDPQAHVAAWAWYRGYRYLWLAQP